MKKNRLYTFIKIKIGVLLILFLALVAFLQSTWVKNKISNRLAHELALFTQSDVSIKRCDGLIPLSIDFFSIEFKYQQKTWLTIERLSLNKILFFLLTKKQKGLDLSVDGAKLLFIPNFNPQKETFRLKWPKIPYRHLNLSISGNNIEIGNEVFGKTIPPDLWIKSKVEVTNYGANLNTKSEIGSDLLKETELHIELKGTQKNNKIFAEINLKDLEQELKPYIANYDLPSFSASVSASGSLDAILAFVNPEQETEETFKGEFIVTFLPSKKNSPLWQELLQEENLQLDSKLHFDNLGLTLSKLSMQSPIFSFSGTGILDRNYYFNNTLLIGKINDLNFTKFFLDAPLEGSLSGSLELKDYYLHPTLKADLNSEKVAYQHLIAHDFKTDFSLTSSDNTLNGLCSLNAELNQTELNSSFEYSFTDTTHFILDNFLLKYGGNSINTPSLKKVGENLQSRLHIDCKNLALFSPIFKQELHGDCTGTVFLDLDVVTAQVVQLIEYQLSGSNFQYPNYTLTNYSIDGKSTLTQKRIESVQGELFFAANFFGYKHMSWDNTHLYLKGNFYDFIYKVQADGEIAFNSAGHLFKNQEEISAQIRQLTGHIRNQKFTLIHPTTVELSKTKLMFSPLLIKTGIGQVFMTRSFENDSLHLDIRKFPMEFVSFFIPGLEMTGLVNVQGDFNDISSQASGNVHCQLSEMRIQDFQNRTPYHGQFNLTLQKNEGLGNFYLGMNKNNYTELFYDLPFSLSLYPFTFDFKKEKKLNAELKYLGAINPFIKLLIPQSHVLDGCADINLAVTGSFKNPDLEGYLRLNKTYYENLYLGLVLKNIEMEMTSDGDKLQLKDFSAYDEEDGEIEIKGSLLLNPKKHFPYELYLSLNAAEVLHLDFLNATLTGKGELKGDFKKAYLEGKFKVPTAQVNLPKNIGTSLPVLDVTYLYPHCESSSPIFNHISKSLPVYFDVELDFLDDTSLKGRGLDSMWAGNLKIQGSDQNPRIKGELVSQKGTFDFAGRLFTLTESTINFNGNLLYDTAINLFATHQIDQHQIYIHLKGPLKGPYLSFRSEPSLSQREVLSLVLFGQTAERLTAFQAVALTHTLATLGGVYQGPGVVDKLRKGIGLDQLTLGSFMYDNKDYTTIQVGKYITRGILITLNRPITEDPSPFIITAQFRGGFQFQTYFDQSQLSRFQIQWRFSY